MKKASIGRRLATAALCACLAAMGIPAAALATDGPAPGADTSLANNPVADASATTARALTADGPAPGEGEAAPVVLASFEEPNPASYDVAAGEDLPNLPGSLPARDGDGARISVEGVSWECADADPAAPGAHVFTAVLPEGYEAAPGAQLPQVTVTVAAPQASAALPGVVAPRAVAPAAPGNGPELVLEVVFDGGDGSGTAMRAAIDEALAKLPEGKDRGDVTDIAMAGDATAIAGDDWAALKNCYKGSGAWTSLSGLDLFEMDKLAEVSGGNAPDKFDKLVGLKLPEGLKTVGEYVFQNCRKLALDKLPENVSSIGPFAFSNCFDLALAGLPDGVESIDGYAFGNCNDLALDRLPDGVRTIGDFAFYGCTGLKAMSFPSGLKSVGQEAFESCTNLEELSFSGDTPPTLGTDAFNNVAVGGTVYCPDAKTYEDSFGADGPNGWTYASLYKLEVEFNGDGTAMQDAIDEALVGKDKGGVKDIVVTGAATKIAGADWTALKDCYKDGSAWTSLSGLDLFKMDELGTVSGADGGAAAFGKLARVWLPDTLGSIGDYAFSGCSRLDIEYLPESVTSVGGHAFQGCTNLALRTLFDGVNHVGESAFEGCTSLVFGRLPDSIEVIEKSAFSGCEKLDLSEIPANVSAIEPKTFYGCKDLERMSFPVGLRFVGESAFEGCSNLKELSFRSDTPPKLDADAFKGVAAGGTVYCPDAKTYEDSFGANGPSGWRYESFYTLEVTFDGNTAMQGAIDAALAKAGKGKIGAKDIVVTGDATKITGMHDWGDLKRCYQRDSEWANLSGLDLSGMGELTEVSGVDGRILGDPSYDRLVDLKLSIGLETIGEYAFQNCRNLVLDELPSSLEAVGQNAFDRCFNLALDKLPSGLASIGIDSFKNCSSLALEELPAGIEDVPDRAFQGCTSLALAKLPTNLSSIGREAFAGCKKLAISALPKKVSSIGSYAFSKCEGLKAMAFPSGLQSVGDNAFEGCSNLAALEFHGPAPALGEGAFAGIPAFGELYFPQGENYIKGDFGGDDLKGWGFYDMASRTLTDAATGAKVSGVLSSNAGLLAQKGGLHQAGTCDACDAMREREASGVALAELCLSLASGRLWGGVEASIPVGAANDGREVAVLHCADGALEEAAATVSGGYATGAFSSLSPFAVVAPKDGPAPAPKPVPTPGSGLSAIAATGDGLGAAPWLALALALASVAALALAVAVRSRSARR